MVLSLILSLVICGGAGALVWRYYKNQQRTQSADNAENTQGTGDTSVYGGKRYQYNTDLTNILFMGVD